MRGNSESAARPSSERMSGRRFIAVASECRRGLPEIKVRQPTRAARRGPDFTVSVH